MQLIFYIFIFYIIISLLSRIGNKKRMPNTLIQEKEDDSILVFSEIQDEAHSPQERINLKQVDNIEKQDKIVIDDEVKEFYKGEGEDKKNRVFAEKPAVKNGEEISAVRESGLELYLSDNILVKGIILSEIIAPPRALKPYDFKRHRR